MRTHPILRPLAAGLVLSTAGMVLTGPAPASAATTTHTVAVGSHPFDVAVSQSLGEAFVVNDGSVSVVSLLTHRALAEVPTGGTNQNAIALVRNDTRAYLTDFDGTSVVDLDTETRQVAGHIAVGDGAVDVARANTAHGQRAYVARLHAKQLAVVQTSTDQVVQRIALPQEPQTVTTAPGGKTVAVGSANQGRVYLVDTGTGKRRKTIKLDRVGPVASIAFAPGGKRMWVAGLGGIAVVNSSSGKTVTVLPIGKVFPDSDAPNMGPIAFNDSGSRLLVVDSTFPDAPGRGSVSVVDTRRYRVTSQVATGVEPEGLAMDNERHVAYVADYADDTVTYFHRG